MNPCQLLLLSSSSAHGYAPFAYAWEELREFVGTARQLYFVPYAQLDNTWYTERTSQVLAPLGVEIVGLDTVPDPVAAIEEAEVVFVGGGNSFRLLDGLQRRGLIEPIRRRVRTGELRYAGSSAGTNMACPSLRTTNDMPILEPASFEATGLIPFQINPHYVDSDPGSTHMGETREQRIREFLDQNDVPVLGLREGSLLRRRGDSLLLGGVMGARLFQRNDEPRELRPGDDLSWLLQVTPRFDRPVLP